MKLKIASLLVVSLFFVSCSSKQKAATPAAPTKQEANKKGAKATAKAAVTKAKDAVANATTGSLVCKSGSDTRSLEVISKDGGCELAYTKFDQTTTPATSASGTAHCDSVKEKIKGNLENSGFKCE